MWHFKLIPVLPNKMLVSQWRECIAIKRQWEKGTLKHRLVSYVMDYDKSYFYNYVGLVTDEMVKRNIKFNIDLFNEIDDFCKNDIPNPNFERPYPEHNDRYLRQNYFNLQEKFDKKIITLDEWDKIVEKFGGL